MREVNDMSETGDEHPASGAASDHVYLLSAEEVDQLTVSLTIVQGYVQLIRRRVLRSPTSRREDLALPLERMERAARDMSSELWDIIGARTSLLDDNDPDGLGRSWEAAPKRS
jgi:hypothetical protein